jgi:predicted nucleic-acid-binding Zn-ribbon protein
MKRSGKCPKCGAEEIIKDAMVMDRSHLGVAEEFTLATFKLPKAFLYKGEQRSTVSAWVCGECGFVELYADEPGRLKV